jgi:hypothetical protein
MKAVLPHHSFEALRRARRRDGCALRRSSVSHERPGRSPRAARAMPIDSTPGPSDRSTAIECAPCRHPSRPVVDRQRVACTRRCALAQAMRPDLREGAVARCQRPGHRRSCSRPPRWTTTVSAAWRLGWMPISASPSASVTRYARSDRRWPGREPAPDPAALHAGGDPRHGLRGQPIPALSARTSHGCNGNSRATFSNTSNPIRSYPFCSGNCPPESTSKSACR